MSLSAYNNHAWNNSAATGDGLFAVEHASISYSSVSGNRPRGYGGGIHAYGKLLVNKSTIADNRTADVYAGRGGGAWAREVHVYDSTLSGNVANSASALLAWEGVRIATASSPSTARRRPTRQAEAR